MDKLKKIFKHGDDDSSPSSHSQSQSQTQSYSQSQSSAPSQSQAAPSQPMSSTAQQTPTSTSSVRPEDATGVLLTTNMGDITIALYKDKVPRTTTNFATLAATHEYDNVIFHRIIPNFMIQGGDPTGTGTGGRSIYGAKFEDEFDRSLVHDRKGVLSMANSGPNTNGSQFFITLAPTPHLNGKHTVFGQVVDGMDVVDRIGSVRTGAQDRPLQPIMIVKAEIF
ncbi:Peptidyl-prolyl cis-trans isomerase-like 1 [Cryomyces minteri]|uniref:Peptidyl-prolyl cis-trans isomerase n=1 Tax=Cryomyces minteri TaxID=331657 RepID=A0A4U0WJS6_9PEZI|nr:Peptidyl-prolyl cis-trans isomerase-like 1 [Cryomyces minteri]